MTLPEYDFSLKNGLRVPPLGRRLRLGQVGGGQGAIVGNWHRNGARLSNHWDLCAGALSRNADIAARSAWDTVIPLDRSYDDFRAMAEAEASREDGIEAVCICTPNISHFEIAKTFMQAGIDVILDKPITTTIADAQDLVQLAKDRNVVFAVTYPYAFHAMIRQAQSLIVQGALGPIRQVMVEYVQDWGTTSEAEENASVAWRRDPNIVGRTSATGDIGTHAYHLMKTMTGLTAKRLRADFHQCGGTKELEDTAFIKMDLSNGAPAQIWVTQAAPGNACGLLIRVFGEHRGLSWDQEYPEQLIYSPLDAPQQIFSRGQGAGLSPAAERLAHLPRGHGEALTDAWGNLYSEIGMVIAARRAGVTLPKGLVQVPFGEDGLDGVKFMEACADSAQEDAKWVHL